MPHLPPPILYPAADPPIKAAARILRTPSYCHHKTKDLAYVRLNGEFVYLGPYGSPESQAKYRRLIAEWMTSGTSPRHTRASGPSLNEVLLAYWRFAEGYYPVRPDGQRELDRMAYAIKPLKDVYGTVPAADFGPLAIKAVRQTMIEAGLCRTTINQRIGCIKRILKWAVSEELVPSSVYHGLQSVDGFPIATALPLPTAEAERVHEVKAKVAESYERNFEKRLGQVPERRMNHG